MNRIFLVICLIYSLLPFVVISITTTTTTTTIPRGSQGTINEFPPITKFFNQTIDHFSYYIDNSNNNNNLSSLSSLTFMQKYLIYDKFWEIGKGPILFYYGNEGEIEDFYNNSGFLFDIAPDLNALIVFLEHRYYGISLPKHLLTKDILSSKDLKYLTIEQALADTTNFLSNKDKIFGCKKDKNNNFCKVILFGGSYGGMLTAWHRLKYPHITVGAIASSAPVDIYPGENKEKDFYNSFINVFTEYGDGSNSNSNNNSSSSSKKCGNILDKAFQLIDKIDNFKTLSNIFHTCEPITTKNQVSKLLFYLKGAIATLAMLDYPYPTTFITEMPAHPVQVACERLLLNARTTTTNDNNNNNNNNNEILYGMNEAINVFVNYTGNLKCHNISMEMVGGNTNNYITSTSNSRSLSSPPSLGSIYRTWNYQACTQLILEPLTSDGNGFYVEDKDQIKEVEAVCRERYPNTITKEKWMLHAYGNGADIVKHTTNMIFSDGDKDPWNVGGVPRNATSPDGSVFHLMIKNSAHHQDLRFEDDIYDSIGLKKAREIEKKCIKNWLKS